MLGGIQHYAYLLEFCTMKLVYATAGYTTYLNCTEGFQPRPYRLDKFFVKAVFKKVSPYTRALSSQIHSR